MSQLVMEGKCPLCLKQGYGNLKLDRRGKPYISCKAKCGMTFLPTPEALRGTAARWGVDYQELVSKCFPDFPMESVDFST